MTNPAFADLRDRHTTVIDYQAEEIEKQIGYVRKRITAGRPETVGLSTESIRESCARILAAVGALGTIEEAEKALAEKSR
jgi:hypothetical protein